MPIFDLFSKRQKRRRGEVPDVYTYDEIPRTLRAQVMHIWFNVFGKPSESDLAIDDVPAPYELIHKVLCQEYGVLALVSDLENAFDDLSEFFLKEEDIEKVLDALELSFRHMPELLEAAGPEITMGPKGTRTPDYAEITRAAIKDLNERFKEHGLGYEFKNGRIIRIDSTIIHEEAVKPALVALSEKEYQGANDEFLKAHEHYRHGDYKECVNEALKSLESTLKIICQKRNWPYSQGDTAKKLIEICFANHLIPQFWQLHFTSLRATLESGIPTARNKLGGHGQGAQTIVVPQHLASYVLHMTASTLLFLIEAEKNLP